MAKETKTQLVTAISRADKPIELPYEKSHIIVAPRGKAIGLDKEKLGTIPQGIRIINQ